MSSRPATPTLLPALQPVPLRDYESQMKSLGQGRFELEAVLGTGGAATVYRARDRVLGVPRAIKVVAEGGASRKRLLGEARAMAQVTHPHILRIHDVLSDGPDAFIVMDLAPRGSLEDRLGVEGPMRPVEAVERILEVLSALDAAHRANIVHRDVKPANILIGADGGALLADFGIARIADETADRQTRVGSALGSVAFMPPEQRLDARSVGPTADIYAVGATLYSLITSLNPVDLFLAEEASPRWLSVPPPLRPILRRATSADPSERHPDVQALAVELRGALSQLGGVVPAPWPVVALPTPTLVDPSLAATQSERPPERSRRGWYVVGAAALAFALVLVGWIRTPEPTTPATPASVPAPIAQPTPIPTPPAPSTPASATPTPATPVAAVAEPARVERAAPRSKAPTKTGFGSWTGSFGGKNADLRLDGSPAALRGELVVRFGGRSVTSPVSGSITGDELLLKDDIDTDDAGTYRATLGADRAVIEGTFTRKNGSTIPMKFSARSP